ncbi:hypothetical protein [Plasticicumulans acidivorans]|uniref:Transcriptional regulator n=1 Tax=Plasticicumulans acidivorans TaxID=886464 RepID=A0A317N5J6_9GAMM|nr:hypothetical protein [Plasticicumulans acidivorans]PWV66019.1 hypothetical protein C7443_101507 [Plasticicumulans acidivorans]
MKRDIFGELMEGIEAMREQREGKVTLRAHRLEHRPLPAVDAALIRATREHPDTLERLAEL